MRDLFIQYIRSYIDKVPRFFQLLNQTEDEIRCRRSASFQTPGTEVFSYEHEATQLLQQTYSNVFVYRSTIFDLKDSIHSIRFYMVIPLSDSRLFIYSIHMMTSYEYASIILPTRSHFTTDHQYLGDIFKKDTSALALQLERELITYLLQLPSFRLLTATGLLHHY